MLRKPILRITLLLLALIVVTTVFFGLAKTKQYSAYAECRELAVTTKGYTVWNYERTFPMVFMSQVVFSDGYNTLTCKATGIGPFWAVRGHVKTNVGCSKSLSDQGDMCPEDYFGVDP